MLAPGSYAQWKSRFMRYVDTKPNRELLKKIIYEGPYIMTEITNQETSEDGDRPREIWIAIERLQQGESINIQDVKTKLFWEFGKFTSKDGESIESYYTRFYKMMYKMVRNKLKVDNMQVNVQFLQQLQLEWSRFVKIVKQANNLDNVSYHTLFDILKQHQNEINEIRAERIARNANLLALNKGKEIVKQPSSQSESASEEDSDEEQAHRDKQIQKSLALNYWQFVNQRINNKQLVGTEKLVGNRVKDYEYHKEKMMLCKQESKGIPLSTEQDEWLQDTYEEPDRQELEAYYIAIGKETVDSNIIPDSTDMCDNEKKDEQNAEEPEDERVLLASLIANLKLDDDENKKIQKQLKKANTSLTQELDKYKLDLKYFKIELERNKTFQTNQKDKEAVELKCKEALDLLAYVQANVNNIKSTVETDWQQHKFDWHNPITHDIKLLVHDMLIPFAHKTLKNVRIFENALKEEMLEDLKYVQSVEKEIDDLKMEIDDLKSQIEHEKTDFPKVDDLLLQEFSSKDFMCVILLSLDDIDEYCEMTCKYLEKTKECERLENELSKCQKENHDKSFTQLEKYCINLELALQNAKENSVYKKNS
ncbi:hypothetical protein Tco_0952096 [Tanacetum coccineum]|uniref:Gag-Pol polyprotein n=1 Tax=Tanacetum coccineum TaxID=301880 RepID=A0ABQ5DYU8_9ASTR